MQHGAAHPLTVPGRKVRVLQYDVYGEAKGLRYKARGDNHDNSSSVRNRHRTFYSVMCYCSNTLQKIRDVDISVVYLTLNQRRKLR